MAIRWSGPIANYGKLTGDRRMFEKVGDLDSRTLPVPLRYSPTGGHKEAVDVGGVTSVVLATNPVMASGFFLPEDIEPLVKPAVYKARAGINGPSLDMDNFKGAVRKGADGSEYLAMRARMMAVSLVSVPAFADNRLRIEGDALTAGAWVFREISDELAMRCYEGVLVAAGVNATGWRGLPVAPRNAPFRVEDAIQRIKQWAGGDVGKYATAFLWQDPNIDSADMRAYRLPVGDIIDGKLTMIYHAVYAGAALLQGAHGGLPSISDADKVRLRSIIDQMYRRMSKDFSEDLEPPWDQGAKNRPLEMFDMSLDMIEDAEASLSVKSSWNLPMASDDTTWDKGAALAALDKWAGQDMSKYASAFLWKDSAGDASLKGSYKFPIATIINGTLTIVPAAVRNAAARVSGASIPAADKASLTATIATLMKRIHGAQTEIMEGGMVAGGGPLAPSKAIFDKPAGLSKKNQSHIEIDDKTRQVKGLIAHWGTCHTGVGNACVVAPHSKSGYAMFHQGRVLTAEGDLVPVGKITMAGGHADTQLGLKPAIAHYDNSTTAVCVVQAHEDENGIAFSGMLMPGVTPQQIFELRACALSGDWRYERNVDNLELIAALAVNSPGFPMLSVTAGVQMSLIAAGAVLDSDDGDAQGEAHVADQVVVAAAQAGETGAEVLDDATRKREHVAAILAADQAKRTRQLMGYEPL